jgi:hypothetical protein
MKSIGCWTLAAIVVFGASVGTKAQEAYLSTGSISSGDFILAENGKTPPIYVSTDDHVGVIIAARNLQSDVERVTGVKPIMKSNGETITESNVVIVGTLHHSMVIAELIKNKKIDTTELNNQWESSAIQVVENPFPNVKRALVIIGSDKRGTIYGIYDVSKKIGVSPWYWWADVPPAKQTKLFIKKGRHLLPGPKVKYRGIFINDEAPALSGWVFEKYGGFNHRFYEKVFELILRMKGNYLWPAMWGRAFYDDDPQNPKLADDYGVVIATSHHEPMMRAHVEWERHGSGDWNYETNTESLKDFWTKGIQRMGSYESVVTLAMRGDGDKAMTESTNIALLEKIVKEQREIISSVTGKAPEKTRQVWALYKEVQDYYDKGMRVPDDVTLLLCDDNWGNIRKLPNPNDKPRTGGYGIYYHYDYVGGPRNYKWLNTNQVSRVWEQMNLAYRYGADRLWIVNVGDIKPMELPTEFFLDYAWDPERWNADNIHTYTTQWAASQFEEKYSTEIAELLTKYTAFNSRRKPELLSPDTYSLIHFREWERVVNDYNALVRKTEQLKNQLDPSYHDAFYQLVMHPVTASANLNELYFTVAKNRLYANQGRASTNDLANRVKELFVNDSLISKYYNKVLAGGKWNHFMDQTHIGYTYWQQPPKNSMPDVKTIDLKTEGELAIAIEGSDKWWPLENSEATLPEFDRFSESGHYIDIFNRGMKPVLYSIDAPGWIKLSSKKGAIEKEVRVEVSIDWAKAPKGLSKHQVAIRSDDGKSVTVSVHIRNVTDSNIKGFVESNAYISIEAEHFSRKVNSNKVQWKVIRDLGRTLSGVTTFPVTAVSQTSEARLEYDVHLFTDGDVTINAYFSPTLNFNNNKGLNYAISIDNEIPQTVNLHGTYTNRDWESWVADNVIVKTTQHKAQGSGKHVLKFWSVDPVVVLQKIVIETKDRACSTYLGPPESVNISEKNNRK